MSAAVLDADPLASLRAAVSKDSLHEDAATLELFRHDVYSRGPPPRAVLRPSTVDELSRGVAAASSAGLAIVPRGGGMSYTGGYLSPTSEFVLIDTARLDRIFAID